MKKQWKWYVYIIECKDNTYYTGLIWKADLRWTQHLSGLGSKYTAIHKPKKLIYLEEYENKIRTMKQCNNVTMKQWKRGFTLIEAIVVLAIIGLITALITVNVQLNRNQHKLTGAAQELALNIRRAQNMAMSGQLQFGGVVPYGYGVIGFSAREYIIFYQTGSSDPTQGCKNYLFNLPEKITLPERISLSPQGQCVYFVPPDPKTYINGVNSGSLTFTLTIDGLSKKVIVDASGRIEVE